MKIVDWIGNRYWHTPPWQKQYHFEQDYNPNQEERFSEALPESSSNLKKIQILKDVVGICVGIITIIQFITPAIKYLISLFI